MLQEFKSAVSRNITNAQGWRTDRKIVVIESDDWGSIRMPNKNTFKKFKSLGYPIDSNPYCKYDTMANSVDLQALFAILSVHRNSAGISPKITFNTVVANPRFDEIKQSKFEEYFYEPFTETLNRYYPDEHVFDLWREGIDRSLIYPQFHGREHVNVPVWLDQLKKGNQPLLHAFDLGFWGVPLSIDQRTKVNIQASYDSADSGHINFHKQNLIQGLKLFEEIFGFRSKTFIANNYIFSESLNQTLYEEGVIGIQSMKYHKIPRNGKRRILKSVYTGKTNNVNQLYLVRNCDFEPAQMEKNYNNVEKTINQIKQSFFWKKPAIIASHRLNFIGSLVSENRDRNLHLLDELLSKILKLWPDVEFMSSNQLVELIKNEI